MNSASLPRRYENGRSSPPHGKTSLLARLIRHFSVHAIATSPTHSYEKFGSLERRPSSRKGSHSSHSPPNGIPSSVSNGDIRSHAANADMPTLSIPICGVKNHGNTCYMNAGKKAVTADPRGQSCRESHRVVQLSSSRISLAL